MITKKTRQKTDIILPSWVPFIYGTACAILIPWTILLAYLLPHRYISHNWDIAWAGFDIFMAILFALTAYFAVKRSRYSSISATMLGTVLLIDAWFDVLTAKPGIAENRSILEAVIIELPLALISFWLAHNVFKKTYSS